MAWVRIDDQIARHAKILKAGPAASWLWVCGLAYCQSQLTDGYISEAALPFIGIRDPRRAIRLAERLVRVGLFDRSPENAAIQNGAEMVPKRGYFVHHYGSFNALKEIVLVTKAETSAIRKRAGKIGGLHSGVSRREAKLKQSASRVANIVPKPHPIPSYSVQSKEQTVQRFASATELEPNGRRADTGSGSGDYGTTAAKVGRLSKERPLFRGERFAIFRWQLDELNGMLGPYAEQFDLHEWFFTLDTEAARETVVISDSWAFVRERTLQEAQSRGLTIAKRNGNTSSSPSNKRIAGLMAGAEACLRAEGGGHEEDR